MERDTLFLECAKLAASWPTVALIIAAMFRGPVRSLVRDLKVARVKRGDWQVEFTDAREAVIQEIPPSALKANPPPEADLVKLAPTQTIIQAWNDIEATLREVAREFDIPAGPVHSTMVSLQRFGVLHAGTADAINGLRQMRNLAVHAPRGETPPDRAREFLQMANAIDWTIRQEAKSKRAALGSNTRGSTVEGPAASATLVK